MNVPGNLRRFLNRDPWSQRRLYLCHISDNLFHTFFHSPSLLNLSPCLANMYLLGFSHSLPSLRLLERRKRQEGNGLPRRRRVRIFWKLYRGRRLSRANLADFVLFHLALRATPLAVFHCVRGTRMCACARRLSLSIGSTNQRAWSSGHDATVLQRERPIGRSSTVCQQTSWRALAGARASRPFPCVSGHGYTPADLSKQLLIFFKRSANASRWTFSLKTDIRDWCKLFNIDSPRCYFVCFTYFFFKTVAHWTHSVKDTRIVVLLLYRWNFGRKKKQRKKDGAWSAAVDENLELPREGVPPEACQGVEGVSRKSQC